jgi:disulfide bond formation protein DsbB
MVALVAGLATAGSLYFSEVAHYQPCTLCWYQRIAMYSLAIIAITATIRRERLSPYFAVLAALGAIVSTYHVLLERFPDLDTGTCSKSVPCTLVWFERFGFVTLPFMALCGFLAVLAISLALPKDNR